MRACYPSHHKCQEPGVMICLLCDCWGLAWLARAFKRSGKFCSKSELDTKITLISLVKAFWLDVDWSNSGWRNGRHLPQRTVNCYFCHAARSQHWCQYIASLCDSGPRFACLLQASELDKAVCPQPLYIEQFPQFFVSKFFCSGHLVKSKTSHYSRLAIFKQVRYVPPLSTGGWRLWQAAYWIFGFSSQAYSPSIHSHHYSPPHHVFTIERTQTLFILRLWCTTNQVLLWLLFWSCIGVWYDGCLFRMSEVFFLTNFAEGCWKWVGSLNGLLWVLHMWPMPNYVLTILHWCWFVKAAYWISHVQLSNKSLEAGCVWWQCAHCSQAGNVV